MSCTAILANTRQENSVGLLLGERRQDHTPTPCPRSCPNEYQIRLFLTRRVGEGGGWGGPAHGLSQHTQRRAPCDIISGPVMDCSGRNIVSLLHNLPLADYKDQTNRASGKLSRHWHDFEKRCPASSHICTGLVFSIKYKVLVRLSCGKSRGFPLCPCQEMTITLHDPAIAMS